MLKENMRTWSNMKELKPKLLLKYNEFVDLWVDMIFEYVEPIESTLQDDEVVDYSDAFFNALVYLTVLSINALSVGSKINKDIIATLEKDIKESVCKKFTVANNLDDASTEQNFQHKYQEFVGLMKHFKDEMTPEMILLSFSRVILNAQKLDQKNQKIIINLNENLTEAVLSYDKLSKNSGVSLKNIGKPNFMIQRD